MNSEPLCAHVREQFANYLAGTLSHDERAQVDRHVALCAHCQQALSDLHVLRQSLSVMHTTAQATIYFARVRQTIFAKIQAEEDVTMETQHHSREWTENGDKMDVWSYTYGEPTSPGASAQQNPLRAQDLPAALLETPGSRQHQHHRQPRHKSMLVTAATIVIMVLTAAIFAHFAVGKLNLSDTQLSHIQMLSTSEGWATGTENAGSQKGVFLHFHDSVWSVVGDTFPNMEISNLAMVSRTEGWALGAITQSNRMGDGSDRQTVTSAILHFTGGHWHSGKTLPGSPLDLVMVSADEGWLSTDAALYHYHNGNWSEYSALSLASISMVSADEGWAITLWQPSLAHYYQHAWHSEDQTSFTHVQMLTATDGWAAGEYGVAHYNGQTWQNVAIPSDLLGNLDSAGAIYMSSGHDGWLTVEKASLNSSDQPTGDLLHYRDGQWTVARLPSDLQAPGSRIGAISAISATEAWAIGTTFPFESHLLHYVDGAWSEYVP